MKANCAEFYRFNGTGDGSTAAGWDLIGRRTNVTVGNRDTDVVEGEEVLDCTAGASTPKTYEPGQKTLGEWSVSVVVNPTPTAVDNSENHHLMVSDYETQTATFFKIKNPNGTGAIVHAFTKTDGEVSYDPNQNLVKQFTLQPTGAIPNGHINSADVDADIVPVGITAPQAGYTAG